MEKSIKKRIVDYQFEDARTGVRSVVFGNGLLWLIFFMYDAGKVLVNPFATASLLSVILVLVLICIQDWKSIGLNLLAIGVYLLIFIIELGVFGIPQSPVEMREDMGRGFMLEVLLMMTPCVYTGMRLLLVIPLVQIYWKAKKLNE